MKNTPVPTQLLTGLAGALALMLATSHAYSGPMLGRGTDIFHYGIKKAMANPVSGSLANGRVDVRENKQGKVTVQTLDVTVRKLDPSTDYILVVPVAADPLVPDKLDDLVAAFKTDRKGNAALRFHRIKHENGQGLYMGKGKLPLPDMIQSLTDLKHLAIKAVGAKAADPALLTTDLTDPDKLTYLVKRDISTAANRASLQITANNNVANLRLYAYGLTPSTESKYKLVLVNHDGTPTTDTFSTDAMGRLMARTTIEPPLTILTLATVKVEDDATPTPNVILSATLP